MSRLGELSGIRLRTVGDYIVVDAEIGGRWAEFLRVNCPYEGVIDATVDALGILYAADNSKNPFYLTPEHRIGDVLNV